MKLTYMQRFKAALTCKSGEGTYGRIAKEYRIKMPSLQEIQKFLLLYPMKNTCFDTLNFKKWIPVGI